MDGAVESATAILSLIPWGAVAAIASVLLVVSLFPKARGWWKKRGHPDLRVAWAKYSKKKGSAEGFMAQENEDDVALVNPSKEIVLGIVIHADYPVRPTIIETRSEGDFAINRASLYVTQRRPWEKPYPSPDLHGQYKVMCDGLEMLPEGTSSPAVIDIQLLENGGNQGSSQEPDGDTPFELSPGQEEAILVIIEGEGYSKPFKQKLWIRARALEEVS